MLQRITAEFGVSVRSASQVSGGQDSSATVWRGLLTGGASVAIKLSRRAPSPGLAVSSHLAARGVPSIVAALRARSGKPSLTVDGVQVSVLPWILGRRGADTGMTASQWRDFGELLARVHEVELPAELRALVPAENYVPVAVDVARRLARQIRDVTDPPDALTRSVVGEWQAASESIDILVDSVDELGTQLRTRPVSRVLCHGDAHIANVLLDRDGRLWLLDWDEVVVAPRERDLMFVVGGVLSDAPVTADQQSWFFDGYGHHDIDQSLLAYYRCDWALQDLTDFAQRVLDPEQWPDDRRAEALRFFQSLLWPTGIVDLSLASLRRLGRI